MSDDEVDEYGDQYELPTFFRRVLSVADAPLRRRQVERHFTTVDAETVADHLQAVIVRAARGEARANELLFPITEFINSATVPEALALEAIDLAGRDADLHGVSWLLLEPPPARVIDQRALTKMASQGQSLGHRKSEAGRSDPRTLDRLTRDDHPMVIERLCMNPRVQESHIMTIVTRRPTLPELIATVAASPRWYQRPRIREAIVHNPYGPTGLSLRALVTLTHRHWLSMRHAQQVHPAVRGFAAYLCNLREGDARGPTPAALTETKH